jgi:hypothetical protein
MNRLRTRLRASIADGPLVLLDFLSGGLDSRVTFSRGSNATLVDSTGKITYAPANLLTYSEQFDNAAWTKTRSSVTANATASPDGTVDADKLVEDTTAANNHFIAQAYISTAIPYTFTVYAKAAERGYVTLFNSTVTSGTCFDLITGVVGVASGTPPTASTITAIGNGWYRCSITVTATAASNVWRIHVMASNSASTGYDGNGTSGIFVWGAQLEQVTYQTTPSTYVATTASAYYGPRFDYDPVTLAPKGLLIEEARTNLLLQSETFDNASWAKFNATVTANATLSPDGTTNADKLIATNGGSNAGCSQIPTLAASTAYTETVFAKKGEWNWVALETRGEAADDLLAWFNLNTGVVGTVNVGATATITNFGNGWYRCSLTRTTGATTTSPRARVYATNADAVLSTGDGTSGIFIYGAQLEAGSFATSYIPTVASQVTRNADVATMTGTNFSSWYNQSEGTFVVGATVPTDVDGASGNFYLAASDGTIANQILLAEVNGTTGQIQTGGVLQFNSKVGTEPTGVVKAAIAFQTNNTIICVDGTLGTLDTSVALPTVNRLSIGIRGDSNSTTLLNGHIRQIAYYNTRLPNSQLQEVTAPSLAITLNLDFINGTYDA